MKKVTTADILLLVLIGLLVYQNFFSNKETETHTVTIPEQKGQVEKVIERVVVQPVVIRDMSSKQTILLDKKWKEKYDNAKDSLEKLKLYYKAIQIRDYNKTFVDNDTIKIYGNIKTRGSLLSYKFDYKIKQREYSFKVKKPLLTGIISIDAGLPFNNKPFALRGNLMLLNRKGNGINFGYDTNNQYWIGISKKFTLIK